MACRAVIMEGETSMEPPLSSSLPSHLCLLNTYSPSITPPSPAAPPRHARRAHMAEGKARQSGEATTQALLGKRPRRTTSMTEFSFKDLTAPAAAPAEDAGGPARHRDHRFHQRAPAPRCAQRRSFGDFGELDTTARFLTACGLCNRRLGPGCDTFIYRGEIAFCSLECRQQKMNQDGQKTGATAASESSGTAQTAVAA